LLDWLSLLVLHPVVCCTQSCGGKEQFFERGYWKKTKKLRFIFPEG